MDKRLKALRGMFPDLGVDGVMIPRGDAFAGEEVAAADERLAFISGFTGSAGMAVVTADRAALFSDGRYTLQMENQTGPDWECFTSPEMELAGWLAGNTEGMTIGFDPWLVPVGLRNQLERHAGLHATFKPLAGNPVDAIWQDRPPRPRGKAMDYPAVHAGLTRREKIDACLARMGAVAKAAGVKRLSGMLISDPAALAWLLNIRGRDLDHTPVVLAFAFLDAKGGVKVFAEAERFADCDREGLAFAAASDLPKTLKAVKGSVLVGLATCPVAVEAMLGKKALNAENPIHLLKAVKTETEVAAFEEAHRLDAVAMIRFLNWFGGALESGPVREAEVAEKLVEFRSRSPAFISPSFSTICGGGPNGAIVHYRAEAGSDIEIPRDNLCLVDSGGQYEGATTDITRTIATGEASPEQAARYTTVLKAHIALARCRFPDGTTGVQLDAIARAPLWRAGLDYNHGTGHGVGCGLGVHEGPASISRKGDRAILAGMVLSNEPGFYEPGAYGIRIENLVHIRRGDDGMLYAHDLTLVPYDRRLIQLDMLDAEEAAWIDAYHGRVAREVGPMVGEAGDAGLAAWFEAAVAPLD